jgi:putative hydrolase of the HAD superfamily
LNIIILIKRLKKNYKVALLTNLIDDLNHIIRKNKLRNIFDVIVTSYDSKITKPDIRIFKKTVNELKIKPEECIFIDNMEKNRPPAEELGMKFILFKDYEQLKRDLKKLDIKF